MSDSRFSRIRSAVGGMMMRALKMTPDELEKIIRGAGFAAPASSGEVVTPETAMRNATVQACVRVLVEDVGKLPLILYRRTKDGGKERAVDHPLYKVLRVRPNAWQTPMSFFGMGQAHMELRGAAVAYITRVGNEIRELLPLQTERVTVTQRDDWSLDFRVKFKSGAAEPVPASNILYVPGMSLDGITGVSTITYAREAIGLGIALEKHGGKLFRNGATPSGVLSRPKELSALSAEAGKRLLETFIEGFSGSQAMRTALLEEGITFTPVTMTSDDAQFLETRQYQRTDICGVFRVAPQKIGDHSRSTFNNIEQLDLWHLADSLIPRLVRWEQAINRQLLTIEEQDEYFVEFLVDAVLRADFKSRMDGYAVAIQNGIMNPDEARGKENMNPRPGGDQFLRPGNMVPWNSPAPAPAAGAAKAVSDAIAALRSSVDNLQ